MKSKIVKVLPQTLIDLDLLQTVLNLMKHLGEKLVEKV
ncbi:hypothetical protein X839_10045 [Streptococcus thermophilus MTH17CL396]|nr:hypothetical protein X839_10045 [Streptococcus thermophilus MTH17CL396]